MNAPAITPVLGILDSDAPSQNMLVVIYGAADAIKWTYVSPGPGRNQSHRLEDLKHFTPLRSFGIKFGMMADGNLRLTQFSISTATYADGTPRPWQGASDAVVRIMPTAAGKMWRAVNAEFMARAS